MSKTDVLKWVLKCNPIVLQHQFPHTHSLKHGLEQETETALSNYARALDRRASLEKAVRAARLAATITRARQREGLVNSLELLDTERTLAEATADLTAQDTQISTAQIDIFRSLGGGW